jgi:hypothetical protein
MAETEPRNFIPEEYKFADEYCFFLHDILADIIVFGEQEKIFHHSFEIKGVEDADQLQKKSGEELTNWMEINGYAEVLREANRRQICVALLADFCQFIFEALDCSRKGKLVVSYALLRKPIKENLFYFEWLLADSRDFLNRFHTPLPKKKKQKRALPQPIQLTKEKRLEIIRGAIEKTGLGEWISPEFIHELRYEKDVEYGLEWLFQRANHLITTFTAETEEQNFNFVFSDDEDRLAQWRGLYTTLPILLFHTFLVVDAVINSIADGKLGDLEFMRLRAIVGFLLYIQNGPWNNTEFDTTFQSFLVSFSEIEIPCLGCNEILQVDAENLQKLYREGVYICQNCGYKTLLTSRKELLIVGHLLQKKIICPNCNAVIEGSKENLGNIMLNMKVTCQKCGEDIEVVA